MPPHVSNSIAFHNPQNCPPKLLRSELYVTDNSKYSTLKRMEIAFTGKRFIHTLVFVLACISIFRLLRFAMTTYSSPQTIWPTLLNPCKSSHSTCTQVSNDGTYLSSSSNLRPITKKELGFLSNIISQRAPCNLLIFGWEPKYRHLVKINRSGTTDILEENPERVLKGVSRLNNTKVYKVIYDVPAKEALNLLKHAREENACAPYSGLSEASNCKLALTKLPKSVYRQSWDVILVDGPSSDGPEAPGRMAAIYTSSMISRGGNATTNVIVHDVDRTIEKWFSWEFLCEENIVSSKGRYWNFKLEGGERFRSNSFCSPTLPSIL